MFRSRDRVYALLIAAALLVLILWGGFEHALHPELWWLANAGPGMIKTCASIVAVWWAGFALWAFTGWWRETYGVSPAEQARQAAAPVERTARVVVPLRSKRDDNPPTQPLPVPPETEPAVNE
jgi:hypothetical protein